MSPTSSSPDKQQSKGVKYLLLVVASVRGIRWTSACVAFCLAVTLWYAVTVRDKVETWVDVSVQFKGAPTDLIISEGLINKLSVRVRVARGLSRSLTGRDAAMVVDLSKITRGSNAIAVTRDMLPFTSAYEVVEISPSRIQVAADTRASREIELESRFDGKLAADLFVKTVQFTPQKVAVSGAETIVGSVSRIRLPIPLSADMAPGKNTVPVAVPMPANVAVTPPQVEIEIVVGVRTKQLKFTREVIPSGGTEGQTLVARPGKVTIVANIPESLARDQEALSAITATVSLPADGAGEERKLPVIVKLPEHAELVSTTPAEVEVSIPED